MGDPGSNWIISAYEQAQDGVHLPEYALPEVTAEQVRQALGLPYDEEDPELFYVYPIQTREQATRFEHLLGVPLDLDAYDWFLDCHGEDESTPEKGTAGKPRLQRQVYAAPKGPEEEPLFEYELPGAPDEQLRALLGPPSDEQDYYTRWRIEREEVAARLTPLLRSPLDLSAPYQYFLEYWNPHRTRPTVLAYPKGQSTGPRTAVSQYPLHDATKEQLRSILGLRVDDPMTGWYPVRTEAQAAALSRFLDTPLDLAAYDHAVDYYQPLHEPRVPPEKK